MSRVAAIDIGSNTVLLLVAERAADGALRAVHERETITRLSEGAFASGRLSAAAIARTNACVDDYAADVRRLAVETIGVVATSAMRDAAGGENVSVHVARAVGVAPRVLSGDEEARLTFAGALSGIDAAHGDRVSVFDIGAGSTEVVVGSRAGAVRFARSLDLGSVRLTERRLRSDPPATSELDQAARDVHEATLALPALEDERPIGIAGTMTTLAAVALGRADGRTHGATLAVADVVKTVEALARMSTTERRALVGMDPKRADVIVGGGLIATRLLQLFGAKECAISDRGVRWGLAAELMTHLGKT